MMHLARRYSGICHRQKPKELISGATETMGSRSKGHLCMAARLGYILGNGILCGPCPTITRITKLFEVEVVVLTT